MLACEPMDTSTMLVGGPYAPRGARSGAFRRGIPGDYGTMEGDGDGADGGSADGAGVAGAGVAGAGAGSTGAGDRGSWFGFVVAGLSFPASSRSREALFASDVPIPLRTPVAAPRPIVRDQEDATFALSR